MFGSLGLASGALGSACLTLIGIQKFFFSIPMGARPMLVLGTMLVVVGLQFICFGLLAEVMVRTYHESQNKKTYAVRDVLRSLPAAQESKVVGVI